METKMNPAEIMAVLPHRFPFLMIDRVLDVVPGPDPEARLGRKATVIKNVTMNEQFFVGHFPGRPIMPGVLILEALAQAGCMAFYKPSDANSKIEVAIASVRDARFRRPVIPGDTLVMTAEIIKDRGQMIVLHCEAKVDGQPVAEAEILASIIFKSKGH
ncbi:MAG: 3-hydroxyacyl-ACP dehydratase FabZ [Bdellovibrionales bacterium]